MRQKHVIRYLERLAVDDETAVELILQKVQLILRLFSRLDYIQNEVSTYIMEQTKNTLRLATW